MRYILLALITLCLIACDGGDDSAQPSGGGGDKPLVVTTTTMITDLARQIAGNDAEVRGIMRAGEDPHIYEVRPHDAEMIRTADLVLMNGFHLESTLHDIAVNRAGGKLVELAEAAGIEPIGSDGAAAGAPDPHCWFHVGHFRRYAEAARDAMIAMDPRNREGYEQRAAAYIAQLAELDSWVRQQLAIVPRERRVIVTSHDAFGYFGRYYDVDVHAIIGISTEQQPKPQDLQRLEELVRQRGVKALFIETSVSQTLNNLVRKLAETTGARIGGTLYSDSLADEGEPAGTYIGMIRHNVQTIVDALK